MKVGGKYRCVFGSDGKSVLKIDGKMLDANGVLDLKSGEHELVAEYVHGDGVARAQLKWAKVGEELEVLRLR